MRIAVPYENGQVAQVFDRCQTLEIYEDDHGKVHKQYAQPVTGEGRGAVVAALERCGADAVLCADMDASDRLALAAEGIMLFTGFTGNADEAVLAFLNGAVAFDPNNPCNACGHGHSCSFVGTCRGGGVR